MATAEGPVRYPEKLYGNVFKGPYERRLDAKRMAKLMAIVESMRLGRTVMPPRIEEHAGFVVSTYSLKI